MGNAGQISTILLHNGTSPSLAALPDRRFQGILFSASSSEIKNKLIFIRLFAPTLQVRFHLGSFHELA